MPIKLWQTDYVECNGGLIASYSEEYNKVLEGLHLFISFEGFIFEGCQKVFRVCNSGFISIICAIILNYFIMVFNRFIKLNL